MGFISIVPLVDFVARRTFLAAGLRPDAVSFAIGESTTTVHFWAPPGPPRHPPLLLIHGFGPKATWQWRRQVGTLSRHFHVIVPDLLFFGDSTTAAPPPPGPVPETVHVDALAALLEGLPGLAGKRVAVAGTSYGGFVAYGLARKAGPERVGPVVIASSDLLKTAADDRAFLNRAGGAFPGVTELLLPAAPAAVRRLMDMAFYRPPPRALLPDFVLRDVIQRLFMDKREEKIALLQGITIGKDDFQLTPLPQDVLIIWGEHDQLFPLEKAFAIKRCLGVKARLEISKNTGHAPQMEDSSWFNRTLLDFLQEKSPSARSD